MKRIIIALIFIAIVLTSCEKRYKYVEITVDESVLGGKEMKEKEPKIIRANSDSTAYLDAYESFCISLKVSKDMEQSIGKVYSKPIKFKLLNDKEEDITNSVFFKSKAKQEKIIETSIFSMKNSLQESVEKSKNDKIESFKKNARIDSAKIEKLVKYFRLNKDEFSNNNLVWYIPRTAPQYANMNGIYCYFQTENGMPSNFRFKFQYYAEDWLFFSRIQFSIDGKAYEYIPSKTETDSGNGGYIWEWFDEPLTDSDKELIYALAYAKSAKMKIIGRQYHKIQEISLEQINSIKNSLELFRAMGGNY